MSKKPKGNLEEFLGGPFIPNPDEGQDDDMPVPMDAEEAGEMFGEQVAHDLLSQALARHGWEEKAPADSEWHTAAPVQPLVELGQVETESAPRVWDGPIKERPKTVFDQMFDAEELEAAIGRAPVFHKMTGRFDPFELLRMRSMLEGEHYSTFLHRPVLTFRDALDHSIQLCRFWSEEDAATEAAKQKEDAEWVPPPPTSDSKEERIEAARVAWKNAVAQRKEAVAQWDAYVAEMRLRYNYEKRGR